MALGKIGEHFDNQLAHRPLQSLFRGFDGLSGDGDWLFLALVSTEPASLFLATFGARLFPT